MPRVGPGDDNITGDRYTLDLGVEPDLGNLLQNLQEGNDLLEAAGQKFRDISDIVNSSTQRMTQFTRQTALAAAEAQRLQNSYQQIASSSFTLANIGGMAMGGMGGGMPGYFPGQMAFQGMPPVQQNVIQTMPSGVGTGRPSEDIAEFSRPPMPQRTNLSLLNANAIENITGRFTGGPGRVGQGVSALKSGFARARHGWQGINPNVAAKLPSFGAGNAAGVNLASGVGAGLETGAVQAGGSMFASASEAMAAGFAPEAITGLGAAGGMAGMAGGLGAAAGAAAPWALAAIAGYKLWAGQTAEARRLSGITGNTGLFSGATGGSVGMKLRSIGMGLIHPGVDYGRVQEEAAGTGAIGETYNQTRDFLFEAAKRGMSDTIDMVDLYREGVQKAGGSTAQLTESIDSLRQVAATSNANLTAMTKNFKANMETFTALGMGGSTAMATSLMQATANARYSPVAQANPALINSNGLDIGNPYLRAQVTANLGINYNQLGTTTTLNPVLGGNLPMLTEQAAIQSLKQYGFRDGMTYDEIIQNFQDSGLGDQAGTIFQQMGLIPPDIDPNNIRDVAMSIQTTMGAPVAAATEELNKAGDEQTLYMNTGPGGRGSSANIVNTTGQGRALSEMGSTIGKQGAAQYVTGTLGIEMRGGGILGIGEHDNAWRGLAEQYEAQIQQTGKSSPIFDEILRGMQGGNNFMVRDPEGNTINLDQFMKDHPDWQDLLRDETSGWEIASIDASKQQALDNASESQKKQIYSDLGWGTGDQLAAGELPKSDPNDVQSEGSSGEYDLGEKTLARLDEIFHRQD